jgi:hypothetical protein
MRHIILVVSLISIVSLLWLNCLANLCFNFKYLSPNFIVCCVVCACVMV